MSLSPSFTIFFLLTLTLCVKCAQLQPQIETVRENILPVVIFGPLATKPLEFLRVWGLGDLFSIWLHMLPGYQWWVGKE